MISFSKFHSTEIYSVNQVLCPDARHHAEIFYTHYYSTIYWEFQQVRKEGAFLKKDKKHLKGRD